MSTGRRQCLDKFVRHGSGQFGLLGCDEILVEELDGLFVSDVVQANLPQRLQMGC